MRLTLGIGIALCLFTTRSFAQECVEPPPGLRVWWDADDTRWVSGHSIWPYATDITNRISGPPLLLSALNEPSTWTPLFAPGQIGQAFAFDPADPATGLLRMFAEDHAELDFTTAMTLELWMKAGPQLSYPVFTLVSKQAFQDTGFQLYGYPSTGQLVFRIGHGGGMASYVDGLTNVLDGTWHHIVATFDAALPSDNIKLFVDGALERAASSTGPIQPNDFATHVGLLNVSGNAPYSGLIDEVALFDRALDPAEIDAAYHAPGKCRPSFPARPTHSEQLLYGHHDFGFGRDLALDGDVMGVAAPLGGGAVEVYRRGEGVWVHEQRLQDTYGGVSVAVSGDVVVSGRGGSGTSVGGLAIYRHDGATWNQEFLVSNITYAGDSVAAHGDTVALSVAELETRVYRHDGAQWQQEATLQGPARSVALGENLLVVGAHLADQVGADAGALYVYRRVSGSWAQVALVTPDQVEPGRASYDGFGFGRHVHIDGERLLVGASGAVATARGAAYILDLSGGGVALEVALKPSLLGHGFAGNSGGRSVFLDGDLAAIGASSDLDELYPDYGRGSIYVFARRDGVWTEIGKCRTGAAGNSLDLGNAVALHGGDVLAAAPGAYSIYTFPGFAAAIENSRPISDAGPDQVASEGTPVTLDGSGSFDGDGDPLSYAWAQIGGPAVVLSDPGSSMPGFTAPFVNPGGETLTFQLLVDDGELESDTDVVNVTVTNINSVPVAEAGADQTVAEGSQVQLSGGDSYDVDEETLGFAWTQIGGTIVSLTGANQVVATFTAPSVGPAGEVLTFELRVDDGIDQSAPDAVEVSVTNVNNPPVAYAGPGQTVDEATLVFLDGSGSSDPDGDPLSYSWAQVSGPVATLSNAFSATPSFVAPNVSGVVDLVFSLSVHDGQGSSSEASFTTVTVRDGNAAPDCSQARSSRPTIWPPNHKMVAVQIVGVHDPDDASIQVTILGVWQDEPTNGQGDGDTGPADAVIQGDTVLLRAERSGLGDGRVYHISFSAQDASGAQCQGTVQVAVPHDKKHAVVDGGPLYDSTH